MPEGCVDIGGEIKQFDPARYMDKRTIRKTDRFAQIAVNAAGEAIDHSGIDIAPTAIGSAVRSAPASAG